MYRCLHCGAEVKGMATYCSNCGMRFSNDTGSCLGQAARILGCLVFGVISIVAGSLGACMILLLSSNRGALDRLSGPGMLAFAVACWWIAMRLWRSNP